MSTKLGYNYYPDQLHFRREDAQHWVPILGSLGASWLVLNDSLNSSLGIEFIEILQQGGIEPVVHIPGSIQSFNPVEINNQLLRYAQMGISYVVLGDRPNVRTRWKPSEWSRQGFIERYIDNLLPLLISQQEAGLMPILPPAEPGGDYWDTAFLQSTLDGLKRRAPDVVLDNLVSGIYLWTYEKPISWGTGGANAWPGTRAYFTPDDMQDQLGFRIFEWYASIANQSLGRDLPLLALAGGARVPYSSETSDDEDGFRSTTMEIVDVCQQGNLPDYLLNVSFYLLAAQDTHPQKRFAWFQGNKNTPRSIVPMIQRYLKNPDDVIAKNALSVEEASPYLLLQANVLSSPTFLENERVHELLQMNPRIGYSAEEAARAKQVVLLQFDPASLDEQLEERLRSAGTQLEVLNLAEEHLGMHPKSGPSAYDQLIESIRQGASHVS